MGNRGHLALAVTAGLVFAAAVPAAHANKLGSPGFGAPDTLTVPALSDLEITTGKLTISTSKYTGTIQEW